MGLRTYLLLSSAPDWRWMLGRSDTPWYPSAKLYRQTLPGDWRLPVMELVKDMTALR
jgi:hypothetical protein